MLETVLSFGSALIEGLSKIKITKTDKKKIGQALCQLYFGLSEITENGINIITVLKEKGSIKDFINLHKLLYEQSLRIKKIKKLVESPVVKKIFKIYLPEIEDLQVLVERKGERVAILVERIEEHKMEHFRPVALDFPIPYFSYRPTTFVKPSSKALTMAKDTLAELEVIARELREFIIANFEVTDII